MTSENTPCGGGQGPGTVVPALSNSLSPCPAANSGCNTRALAHRLLGVTAVFRVRRCAISDERTAIKNSIARALEARIARIPEKGSSHPVVAWIGIPVIFFAILMALVAAAPFGAVNEPSPLGYVYCIIAAVLCGVAWALIKRTRRSIRAGNIGELRALTRSLDRGCGDAECRRCYSSF